MLRTAITRRTTSAVLRRTPAAMSSPVSGRMFGDGRSEGYTASSQGFSKKEKAHEDQFIRAQEKAKLDKLRADLAKQREALAALEAEHAELEKKVETKE